MINKDKLTMLMEWIRPSGIILAIFLSEYCGIDPVSKLHILGPIITILMCGTVAFESLFLGEAAAKKIGYATNRAYQIQSGLANLAIAVTAIIVSALNWGRFADASITIVMLMFFTFSAVNHTVSIIKHKNMKRVNLMRPIFTIFLLLFLLPLIIKVVS